MSKAFREHADRQLQALRMEEGLKQRVRQRAAERSALRRPPLRLILAAALILISLGAFALTRGFGLFHMMGEHLTEAQRTVRPEAYEMLQTNLSSYSFEHVDVSVREAVYDGKYLRVAYSVVERARKTPFAAEPGPVENLRNWRFEAAEKDGISWETLDWCGIGGEHYNPLGSTGSYTTDQPGEILSWVQFDLSYAELPERFTVSLPLRGMDTPPELQFTMSSALVGVKRLQLPPPARAGRYQIRVTEAMVSPIRIYMSAELVVDAGVPVEDCQRLMNRWMMDAQLHSSDGSIHYPLAEQAGAGMTGNVRYEEIRLPDGSAAFEDRIIDPAKPVTLIARHEFTPGEQYLDGFRYGISDAESILIPLKEEHP